MSQPRVIYVLGIFNHRQQKGLRTSSSATVATLVE